jgi:hypothetical protein
VRAGCRVRLSRPLQACTVTKAGPGRLPTMSTIKPAQSQARISGYVTNVAIATRGGSLTFPTVNRRAPNETAKTLNSRYSLVSPPPFSNC